MDAKLNLIEPLLERAEQYGKTSFELIKLKTVYKTADITSSLISGLFLGLILLLFVLTLNIAIALLLGEIFGKNYYGFLIVSAFYGLVAIIVLFIHPKIKMHINNRMVAKMLN